LQKIGLKTTVKYLKEGSLSFYDIIEKILDKGLIYGVYVTSENEEHNSLSLAILNNQESIESKE